MATIREKVAADIDNLWHRTATLIDDPDISARLRSELRAVCSRLEGCVSILTQDGGPTAADIAGEVVHVQPPF